jgi:hypothetical protein
MRYLVAAIKVSVDSSKRNEPLEVQITDSLNYFGDQGWDVFRVDRESSESFDTYYEEVYRLWMKRDR